MTDLEPVAEEEEAQSDVPTIVEEVQIEVPIVKQVADIPESYIPFLDAFQEMMGFAKYLKELLTKKRPIKHDTGSEERGSRGLYYSVARNLCDNRASINLMSLAIYKQLRLGMPRPTTMRLQMADRSIKRPVGVVDDVLVRVGDFFLSVDFVILDCAVARDIPIILGRYFLSMGRALMDSEKNEIKFRVNDENVTFQDCKGMKLPSAYKSISIIDAIDVETVNSLVGLGSYTYQPKKLDLDLENRTTPPVKPSIVEPPKLELKKLPSHMRYEFLGPNNTLPVIVSALMNDEQTKRLLEIL
ncbi:uncharacterized protein LOC132601525 [Lycium barbarum]|uniref:uncharacterized protein LOC132601525 n=1 Tax=Lycium barbarum TaxID=112863 RepID=UPI00293ED826|nr:uncharacterized protein LOC132601525 [Lycium barbarum]